MDKLPVIVIVGPTASGKTGLSIALAKHYDAEIISADSIQIYKNMDIASAKPTAKEMQGIPHHMLDFLDPWESYSVADYVKDAKQVIADIAGRGKKVIIVGGTGLYIQSLIDNIQFTQTETDLQLREKLFQLAQTQGVLALYQRLEQIDPISAKQIHPNNVKRVIRAIEVYETSGITMSEQQRRSRLVESQYRPCMIGIWHKNRQDLYNRINLRVDQMLADGLVAEAKSVLAQNPSVTAMQAIGYKELKKYFDKELSLEQTVEKIKQASRNYAKRQLTWFKRDDRIHWITIENNDYSHLTDDAMMVINNFLAG